MKLDEAQRVLSFEFPQAHAFAIANPGDPIHSLCDFLVADTPHELLSIVHVNALLHGDAHPEPWPAFLVAFASNGCGDYFAYDSRSRPPTVRYIDPLDSIDENLADTEFMFDSFDDWYAYQVAKLDR